MQSSKDKPAPRQANQRGAARLGAVQALYQMDVGGISLEKTLENFAEFLLGKEVEGEQYLPADKDFFRQIVGGVVTSQLDIDPMIDANLPSDWPVTRIDALLRAILRAAVFELMKRPDIPAGVVISEYLDIARAFYDGEVPGLVNGVLDGIAKRMADSA